jgi:hypothetical protein
LRGRRSGVPQPTSTSGGVDGGDGGDGDDGYDYGGEERAADFSDILPQERVSAKEAERLIFGGKDFTKGRVVFGKTRGLGRMGRMA